MPFEDIVKQVAETIQKEANARAVFAEPAKLDTHVVIPVASVTVTLGGRGGGGSGKPGAEVARFFGGGGGSLSVVATPVGFIHEKDGAAVFTRIEPKPEERSLPLMAERLVSVFASRAEKRVEKPSQKQAEKQVEKH